MATSLAIKKKNVKKIYHFERLGKQTIQETETKLTTDGLYLIENIIQGIFNEHKYGGHKCTPHISEYSLGLLHK